ncbi:hypothetical protein SAMN05518672_105166 [Chitinophaga sp. CF118]|uniref:DUF6134 family protein n=1 Tax=Chitinophaga sp. CF118 TaxID=1884367 RepID=UPI0008E78A97|nr:DUF6134 family protein [Chitinophaga sp. CF118]SFE28710.1 hypothetical protein SAMN05518672_105166 [Chitinophaga sp. CF118]
MRGFTLTCIFITLFTFTSGLLYGQNHEYEVRYANHVIGNVSAHCKLNGTAKNISIQSKVDMRPLTRFNLDISCEFDNSIMIRSKVIRTGKEGDNKSIITQRDGKNYSIIHNGEKSMLNNTEIVHSVSELYFMEPHQISRIYSETLGAFLTLKTLGNGLYELNLPEGKKNVYKYEKGVLVQVEVSQPFGKAFIVRVT